MANTYSQITIHAVFAVKGRENIISQIWRDELHSYLAGILNEKGGKSLSVGGWLDHIHLLFSLPVDQKVSDIMGFVKANSSRWINQKGFVKGKFLWQAGYGAFSLSKSRRDKAMSYIMNQEEHHKAKTFREEYLKLLTEYEVDFNPDYLFEF